MSNNDLNTINPPGLVAPHDGDDDPGFAEETPDLTEGAPLAVSDDEPIAPRDLPNLEPRERLDRFEAMTAEVARTWKSPKARVHEIEALVAALETGEADATLVTELIARNKRTPATWTGKRNICIVGYTASRVHVNDLPREGDGAYEVWGMNNLHLYMPDMAADVWFDCHHDSIIFEKNPDGTYKDPHHLEWMAGGGAMPVFVMEPRPEWPGSVRFPADELLARPELSGYFTNTVSWQMGLAISQLVGVPDAKIAVVGVDMATGTEYAAQRPSCEFYIGLAEALGIDIVIPGTSDLLKCASPYGLPPSPMAAKMRSQLEHLIMQRGEAQSQVNQAQQKAAEAQMRLHQTVGGIAQLEYFVNVWMQPENPDRDAVAGPPDPGQPEG